MDVMASLAAPLPVIIIAEMLGIPAEDHAKFKHWSDEAIRGMGVSTDEDNRIARRAQRELRAYFVKAAAERRREPREDLLSAMIAAEEEGDRLTADELYETCELLLIAGHETTTNLIGNGLLALLQHPDQFDLLRREPERIEHATEELLRYDSPVQATTRIVTEDMTFGGKAVKAGQQLALIIGAANRDPAQFPEPDHLDVTRDDVKHVGFDTESTSPRRAARPHRGSRGVSGDVRALPEHEARYDRHAEVQSQRHPPRSGAVAGSVLIPARSWPHAIGLLPFARSCVVDARSRGGVRPIAV